MPAAIAAEQIRERLRAVGCEEHARAVHADAEFDGGAIPIGSQEVVAADALAELGLRCRPSTATLADMAEALVRGTAAPTTGR